MYFIVYSVDVSCIVVLFLIFAIQYHFVSSLYESNTISLNHAEERFTDEGEYSLPLWWDNQFRKLISSSHHLFLLRYIKNKDIKYTENFCEALAQKLGARQDIPNECRSYDSVKMILNRREAVRGAAAVAFEVRKDRTYMMHSLQISYKIQF